MTRDIFKLLATIKILFQIICLNLVSGVKWCFNDNIDLYLSKGLRKTTSGRRKFKELPSRTKRKAAKKNFQKFQSRDINAGNLVVHVFELIVVNKTVKIF